MGISSDRIIERSTNDRREVDAIIFIPFAEGELDMLMDTVESIEVYVREPHHIVAIDDYSASRLDGRVKALKPHVTVLRNEKKHGGRSGLYITMAAACKYAIEHFNFKVFMKMDTDALMAGPGLVTQATRYFEKNPAAGILGSYRRRADGKRRRWNKWKAAFYYESSFLRHLFGRRVLWKPILREALKHGYEVGENILGGAYFIRYECVKSMLEKKYLDYNYDAVLTESVIGDEIIYSLLCKACGFDLHDFGTPQHSMALALDTLPLSKEEIVATGKTVIHSVKRGKDGESQEELRNFFRKLRVSASNPVIGDPPN